MEIHSYMVQCYCTSNNGDFKIISPSSCEGMHGIHSSPSLSISRYLSPLSFPLSPLLSLSLSLYPPPLSLSISLPLSLPISPLSLYLSPSLSLSPPLSLSISLSLSTCFVWADKYIFFLSCFLRNQKVDVCSAFCFNMVYHF